MEIEDLRFVERKKTRKVFPNPPVFGSDGYETTVTTHILQVKINGQWQDVRLEKETE